jgi:hypothetical protein
MAERVQGREITNPGWQPATGCRVGWAWRGWSSRLATVEPVGLPGDVTGG